MNWYLASALHWPVEICRSEIGGPFSSFCEVHVLHLSSCGRSILCWCWCLRGQMLSGASATASVLCYVAQTRWTKPLFTSWDGSYYRPVNRTLFKGGRVCVWGRICASSTASVDLWNLDWACSDWEVFTFIEQRCCLSVCVCLSVKGVGVSKKVQSMTWNETSVYPWHASGGLWKHLLHSQPLGICVSCSYTSSWSWHSSCVMCYVCSQKVCSSCSTNGHVLWSYVYTALITDAACEVDLRKMYQDEIACFFSLFPAQI